MNYGIKLREKKTLYSVIIVVLSLSAYMYVHYMHIIESEN